MTRSRNRSTSLWGLSCLLAFSLSGCLLTAPPQPAPPTAGPPAPRTPPPGDGFAEPPPRSPLDRQNPAPAFRPSEPTSGAVGSTVVVRGDFANVPSGRDVTIWFAGSAQTHPTRMTPGFIEFRVPDKAQSGTVRITFRRRVLWTGNFNVAATPAEPPINCSSQPLIGCCKALTPECDACRARARAAQAAWRKKCAPTTPVEPITPKVDCSAPPSRMCCMAMTESCMACSRLAKAERAAWEKQCGGPPKMDCSKPPAIACCKAMTEACISCSKRAQVARAAWEKQCRPEKPKTPSVNCSGPPPRRMCCAADTPACNSCRRAAAEENRRWDAACRKP